jgi:hypothetical protein
MMIFIYHSTSYLHDNWPVPVRPGSIERFIEDQAFLRSYDFAPPPPPPPSLPSVSSTGDTQ